MTEPGIGLPSPVGPLPAVVTTAELAAILRVSPSQVRRMNLPSVEVGRGRWRYVTAAVLEELTERAKRGGLTLHKRAS